MSSSQGHHQLSAQILFLYAQMSNGKQIPLQLSGLTGSILHKWDSSMIKSISLRFNMLQKEWPNNHRKCDSTNCHRSRCHPAAFRSFLKSVEPYITLRWTRVEDTYRSTSRNIRLKSPQLSFFHCYRGCFKFARQFRDHWEDFAHQSFRFIQLQSSLVTSPEKEKDSKISRIFIAGRTFTKNSLHQYYWSAIECPF